MGSRTLPFAVAILAGCGAGGDPGPTPDTGRGRRHFENFCAPCHHPDGRGVEGGGPPLSGSPWVSGPEDRLIRIVLHGVRGPIGVGGETYNREMLGFGRILADAEIASLLSFLRDKAGSPPIGPETVGRIRAAAGDRTDYWTVEELLKER